MPNPQNLIPNSARTKEQLSAMGKKGAASTARVKREKKSREERIEYIFNLAVKNKKILKNLSSMGIDTTEMDNETAIDAKMVIEALSGNVNAWKALKDERYGMKMQKIEQTNLEPPKPLSPRKQKKKND